MKTSLIIPAYNEEKGLPMVLEESLGTADEIVVVDDGSTDSTWKSAQVHRVKLMRHRVNLGKPEAIRSGVSVASGDVIIIMDADFTYPAKHLPEFVEEVEGGSDLVLGSRFLGLQSEMAQLNTFGNKIASFAVSRFSKAKVRDPQTGYRAFRKELFKELDVEAKGLEYETKMTIKALKLGLRVSEIPIEYRRRIGESKLGAWDILRMAAALI